MRTLLALLFSLAACIAMALGTQAGPYRVTLQTDPAVVPVGKATLVVHLDQAGKPVEGATVKVIAQMPSMPMGEREQSAVAVVGQPGTYSAPAVFGMAGGYEAKVTIDGPAGSAVATIPLQTGQNTVSSSGGFPWVPIAVAVVVVVAAAWILARMRRAGMHADASGLVSRSTLGALLVIVAVVVAAVWAVNHLRRPGSMTPLEAQVMEMNSPPPPGAAPVTLATVERGVVRSSVRYTGQAVGYNEQDVFARVTGALTGMPPYVGDKVRQGQVLARLDTSQSAPQAAEKAAGVDAARQAVDVASSDYRSSLAEVRFAESEHSQYQAALSGAQADLQAAQQDRESAVASVAAAQADVGDAQARVASAQADATYWAAEIKRAQTLYQQQVFSRDEFQKEKAEADKATAALDQARQAVRGSVAKLKSAQAAVRKADATIAAAQHKVEAARGEMQTHHAHIAKSLADAASARVRISQAAAGVRQAQAQYAGATAQQAYSTIVSPIDGVVVARNMTQGTLVQPGQSILRIAQVSPIRVQANVPTSDLSKVQVGAPVTVNLPSGTAVSAKVTSVQPAVDPNARTGIVEALLPNTDGKIRPGQFVDMEITTGATRESARVPNEAIQSGSDAGSFVWLAEPAAQGQFTVRMVPVTVGDSDGTSTSVLTGLTQGQQVVTSGFINLREGATVQAAMPMADVHASAGRSSEGTPVVKITEAGFVPATVEIPAGRPVKISFLRTTDNTCAKKVRFTGIGVEKELPLNRMIAVDLGERSEDRLEFSCDMDMFKGQVVLR